MTHLNIKIMSTYPNGMILQPYLWENIISIETTGYNTIGLKQNGELICTRANIDEFKEAMSWKNLKTK